MAQQDVNFEPPEEVVAIRQELDLALNSLDETGKRVGNAKVGVYAFYDYDGEPIYVGQTAERLRTRIRRHLTNQRTDAVAMNVLDPFEVAEIEMWPYWDLQNALAGSDQVKQTLSSAEYTVFQMVLEQSIFDAVLNEAPVAPAPETQLPPSVRRRIVPSPVYERRMHPDIRIARRATTIAKLAQVISERQVRPGLRNTLLTQARRLEHLAGRRLHEVGGIQAANNVVEEDDG
jgi:hypothetical protein